jgi:hypothetical protein
MEVVREDELQGFSADLVWLLAIMFIYEIKELSTFSFPLQ